MKGLLCAELSLIRLYIPGPNGTDWYISNSRGGPGGARLRLATGQGRAGLQIQENTKQMHTPKILANFIVPKKY